MALDKCLSLLASVSFRAMVLNPGQFCPSGKHLKCVGTFSVVTTGACNWHLVGRGHSAQDSPTKNELVPNVRSAEIVQLCSMVTNYPGTEGFLGT